MRTSQKNYQYAYHICGAWCNDLSTMMAKPMKTLEWHYPVIQVLISNNTDRFQRAVKS